MSTNNKLIILKNKKGKFEIHENRCMDDEFEPNKHTLLKKEDNLIDAIKFAKEYCNEERVEYGFTIEESALK